MNHLHNNTIIIINIIIIIIIIYIIGFTVSKKEYRLTCKLI